MTVAFGPGLLEGNEAGVSTIFVIQAKDAFSNNRVCGMDEFKIDITYTPFASNSSICNNEILSTDDIPTDNATLTNGASSTDIGTKRGGEEICSIHYSIKDDCDGTYAVSYVPERQGLYRICIDFVGTFQGRAGPIRGSPFLASAEVSGNPTSNGLESAILQKHIKSCTDDLKIFSTLTSKGLQQTVVKEDLRILVSVKEHLQNITKKKKR